MSEDFRTVEINGVKLEVDLRTARRVESYRIGDQVKVLVKSQYGEKYTPHPGVIVGFDDFEKRPTITVAYLEIGYAKAEIQFAYIAGDTEDGVEIAPFHGDILIDKADVVARIDRDIEAKRREIRDLEQKRDYFERHFARYFADMEGLASRVDG